MKLLMTLMGYEYKKILKRKSTWIMVLFALATTLFSCFGDALGTYYVEGKPAYTHYEGIITDRAYDRALTGRELNGELIGEMQKAYGRIPDSPYKMASIEYETYARPYSRIRALVHSVTRYLTDEKGEMINEFDIDGTHFYELRSEAVQKQLEKKKLTQVEYQQHFKMNEKLTIPFTFRYTDGYRSCLSRMYTMGVLLLLTVTACLAPVFASEYTDRTDQLILASRYGKNKALLAKLFTGVSFAALLSLLLLFAETIPALMFYGFDGWNGPLLLVNIMTAYPFTLLEGVIILSGMAVLSAILTAGLCLFLSARLKSSFAVMLLLGTLITGSLFINIKEQYRILYQLNSSLPLNVMSANGTFSDYFFVIFGKCFAPYQALPVIYGIITLILLAGSYRCFKNHEIR